MDKSDPSTISKTITKKELAERIADRTGHKRAVVRDILQEVLEEIVRELALGHRIEFRDFGVFEIKARAARTAQNPRTLERVVVPERRSVRFKPGKKLRVDVESDRASSITEPKLGTPPKDPTDIGERAKQDGRAGRDSNGKAT
ncbi:MAG: integration host factor subunit beta [Phycisphaerales bacterium]|nr:integration host factor subunit beta [Phycisphaerales bacterium]